MCKEITGWLALATGKFGNIRDGVFYCINGVNLRTGVQLYHDFN